LTPLTRILVLAAICAALVGVGAALAAKHYAPKLKQLQSDFDTFKGGVEALGKAAEKRTKEVNEANAKRKKDADAENGKTKRDLAGLYLAYQRLRDQRANAGSGLLPKPRPDAPSPDRITLDRAALDRGLAEADGVLQSGAAKILLRGDQAITNLDTAKRWAK
jgi:hypothetical protein